MVIVHPDATLGFAANVELLANCDGLLHGKGVMGEAAIWRNPALARTSVHLGYEEGREWKTREFARMIGALRWSRMIGDMQK